VGKLLAAIRDRRLKEIYDDTTLVGRETLALNKRLEKMHIKQKASGVVGEAVWIQSHLSAMYNPLGEEQLFVDTLQALETYCEVYTSQYGDLVGVDAVIGQGVKSILDGLHILLNGSTRRLDAGTLSHLLQGFLSENGFPEDS